MIRSDKHDRALQAINAVLAEARFMAGTHAAYDELVAVLDVAEYLPMLFLRADDQTDHFRATLLALAAKFPRTGLAVQHFDGDVG